jgi:hypothetical protein
VFIGRVDAGTAGALFGLAGEGEHIKVPVVPLSTALDWTPRKNRESHPTLMG